MAGLPVEDLLQSSAGFESALGSALNRRPIGQRIAERHAEFDDISARFRKRDNKFECGIERWITRRDVRHDAEFARCAQFGEAFGNARRAVVCRAHLCLEQLSRALDSLKPPSPAF